MHLALHTRPRWILPLLGAAACLMPACRTAAPPSPVAVAPSPASPATTTEPPAFQPHDAAAERQQAPSVERAERLAILDGMWRTVRDKHFDPTLGGVDWAAVRARHEPLALAAPDRRSFYRALNDMLAELGQSHLAVSGPGADDGDAPPTPADAGDAGAGDPGLVVRVIEDRPVVWTVRDGSSAARAGVTPGMQVTHIGGRELTTLQRSSRPLRPVEERFQLRLRAQERLQGPAGTRVTVRVVDGEGRAREFMLEREAPRTAGVRLGYLPPLHPEVHVTNVGDIGVIRFNIFLLEPVLGEVQRAIDGFRARGARGLILDLRGNPGGQGEMAIPVAAQLQAVPLVLGTLRFRDFTRTMTVAPEPSRRAFTGPVVVLTDEGTASTSEILAAGLQEAHRAVVVGDATVGAVLPSLVQSLPGGAVMQVAVADFKTPGGVMIEGRGVQPDRRVQETLVAVRAGKDLVLDAGLETLRGLIRSNPKPGEKRPANADALSPARQTDAASPKRTSTPARSADAIVADFVRATGGEQNWRAHRNLHRRSEIVFPENGIQGTEEQWSTSGDKLLSITTITGAGSPREGCDARACWSQDPINGLRMLSGDEGAQARLGAAWNPELRMRELFPTVRSLVERGADGTEVECVELVPRTGPAVVNCYDPATHLLVSARSVRTTPQGDLPFRTVFEDWRDVGGVKLPFLSRTTTGPITFETRTLQVRFDVKLDDRSFSPPGKTAGKRN